MTNDSSADPLSRMAINSDGNVGIGSDSPIAGGGSKTVLTISDSTQSLLVFEDTGFESSGDGLGMFAYNDGTLTYRTASRSGTDFTGSTNRLVIDANSRISLSNNDSGTSNTIFGKTAGDSDGAGDFNVFVGELSGGTGTQTDACDFNVAVGYNAYTNVTQGTNSTIVGAMAGDASTTTTNLTLIGKGAGTAINSTSANGTTALGSTALEALTGGEKNTAIGFNSASALLLGNRNTAIGYDSLNALAGDDANNGGSDNIAIGVDAMGSLNAGVHNDARANSNIAIGNSAFLAGSMADSGASVSQGNVAIGHEAIMSTGVTPQPGLVAVGFEAMDGLTVGEDNVALGYGTLGGASTSSENKRNTAIGASAMSGTNAGASQNTAIGYASLDGNLTSTADNNTAVGYDALGAVTSGRQNVAVGSACGDAITAGVQNVIVGVDSDISAVDSGNEIVLGYGVTGQGANKATIGNADITDVYMASDSGATVHCANINLGGVSSGGANNLDDYEEGSGSPTVSLTGSGSVTLGTSAGNAWTKVGNIVHFQFEFSITAVSSPVGALTIALPFTSAGTYYSAGSLRVHSETFDGSPFVAINPNSSVAQLKCSKTGSATTDITPTAGTRYFFGQITYRAS